jgi:hypothetical protein
MDSLIAASARSLAAGDALGALKRVALRDDPPALALRGIAMAQLGEHPRARELLRRAARAFGAHEKVARARCVVAEAEVAMAMRDFHGSPRALAEAVATLQVHADHANVVHARLVMARQALLMGRLAQAGAELTLLGANKLPPVLQAVAKLTEAELALRSLLTARARAALDGAHEAARHAGVPALLAEVSVTLAVLDQIAARRLLPDGVQVLRLEEVEALLKSNALVLDACRCGMGSGPTLLNLARRPVLFALARALAEAWPGDVGREALIASVFKTRHPDETHRARLRVEIGRLRALVKPLARIEATARGFALQPLDGRDVAVLVPPIDGEQAALVALLCDGTPWSTSGLALATGTSQRTVQRALAELEAAGQARSMGRGRVQRWLAPPLAGFTTILLLPAVLPIE